MAEVRQGSSRVFVDAASADPVWRKKVGGAWAYLRPRVAPFDPVDLARVRGRFAPRVFEWWLLPDGRSDAWMKRVYGGEVQPLTARTKFAGDLGLGPRAPPREGALISRRFVTERIDRTGELAAELRAVEGWLDARKVAARRSEAAPPEAPPARSSRDGASLAA